MAWGEGAAGLLERFHAARACCDDFRTALTYQGLAKALKHFGLKLVVHAAAQLRRQTMLLAEQSRLFGWLVMAADGSRFDLPRTADNQRAFGTAGRPGSPPQLWGTVLWCLGVALPWDWRIDPADASERDHLRQMLADTPADTLFVADAGFTGYELLRAITTSHRHLLLRVGRNVKLLRGLGYQAVVDHQTVYLWPVHAQRDRHPPLVLRLIKIRGKQGRCMYLLTSVLDRAALSDQQAAVIYRLRWGVELCYRALKQTLQSRKLRSHAPPSALFEMHGLLLGLTLLGLLTVSVIMAKGGDPLRWSLAAALRLVRQAIRRPDGPMTWPAQLAAAIQDSYPRRRKVRVLWPRKKHADPPPGRPQIRRATPAEISLCQQLAVL